MRKIKNSAVRVMGMIRRKVVMNDEGLEYLRHKVAEHQNIEHWAYQNWQWRGSPIGSPEVDWFLAEKEYRERITDGPRTMLLSSFAMGPAEF
jgi:hypothetical protein